MVCEEKPQSAPAITRFVPTSRAKRSRRSAISSGCSMVDARVITPGISTLSSGSAAVSQRWYSGSWRGLPASKE